MDQRGRVYKNVQLYTVPRAPRFGVNHGFNAGADQTRSSPMITPSKQLQQFPTTL